MNLGPLLTASTAIQIHVAAVTLAALAVLAILFQRRGSLAHRLTGRAFAGGMVLAAVSSFWITEITPGEFSFVHLISIGTIIGVGLGILAIWRGNRRAHIRWMVGAAVGGLGVAGAIALLSPNRTMNLIFFG